jgi:hypothetical protein
MSAKTFFSGKKRDATVMLESQLSDRPRLEAAATACVKVKEVVSE